MAKLAAKNLTSGKKLKLAEEQAKKDLCMEKFLQAINKNVAPCHMPHKIWSATATMAESELDNLSQNVHWL